MRFGGAYFLLQDIDVPEWQQNQMITFEVDDLDGYQGELPVKDLESAFPGVKFREPSEFPWGRELHIIDLAGVGWHVRQSNPYDSRRRYMPPRSAASDGSALPRCRFRTSSRLIDMEATSSGFIMRAFTATLSVRFTLMRA